MAIGTVVDYTAKEYAFAQHLFIKPLSLIVERSYRHESITIRWVGHIAHLECSRRFTFSHKREIELQSI